MAWLCPGLLTDRRGYWAVAAVAGVQRSRFIGQACPFPPLKNANVTGPEILANLLATPWSKAETSNPFQLKPILAP
ncbi:hypothetical protein D3C87_1930010 [compost metagenome]